MTFFDYQALDAQGSERRGKIEAATERDARQDLRAQGLTPVALTAGDGNADDRAGPSQSWPRAQRVLFTRQLATTALQRASATSN